ncbi:MAG: glycosyl transferase [Bacteroidota bacterium]|nr:glycosyl transferase [Bacteroidota bacterium]
MSKKILFLTPTLPYPPVSGGVIKSNKVVNFLSEHYDLSIACILKNDDAKHVGEFLKTIRLSHFISQELHIARSAKNLVLSALQGISLNLFRNKSSILKNKIKGIANEYDAIFCDHYVMFQYIPQNFKGRIILHEHNCEYLIWKRFSHLENNFSKQMALTDQARRIKKYEQQICKKSDVILAAPNDINELVKIGADPDKFVETYHLGDDQLLEAPELNFDDTEKSLLYIGTLSWEANIDGLLWFLKDIWKLIVPQHHDTKLYIVGKNPDARLKEIAARDSRIVLTGFIDDVEPYFKKSRVFITPLRFGSGIKVKVVNALYRGIPCVTTPIGAEGLKVIDGEHVFIKKDPEEFAHAIDILLTDKNVWKEMSVNARKIANQYYTWNYVLENIVKAIED